MNIGIQNVSNQLRNLTDSESPLSTKKALIAISHELNGENDSIVKEAREDLEPLKPDYFKGDHLNEDDDSFGATSKS